MVKRRKTFWSLLLKLTGFLLFLLALRVLAGIVYEYQWYFPPDFEASGFLAGREAFFAGAYRIAFYAHISVGPLAMLMGMFLYFSRGQHLTGLHRRLGKIQFLLVVIVLAPSGLVMATRAHTGMIAGTGFALLSIMTSMAAVLAVVHIKRGDLLQHRRWASCLLICLLSPIALRLTVWFVAALGIQPHECYQFSAWASWLIPLILFEIWNRYQSQAINNGIRPRNDRDKMAETMTGNPLENMA